MRLLIIPVFYFLFTGLLWFTIGDRLDLPESFDEVVPWLRSFQSWAWAVAMAVVIADFLLPMPSTPALIGLGVIYGPWTGGALGGVACTTAGMMGFGLARMLGRRGALWLVDERELAAVERFYSRWGIYAVVFGRAVGGPAEWLVLTAGISGMSWLRALLGVMAGGFAAAFVHAMLGDIAVQRPLLALVIVLTLAGAMALVARWMIRARR
ncbi:MAG TPA: VTT domain-containing protein [Candidatus Limnocylindrales bacterium]|nr:VTT domain-containing protein [Candidatus Limnocylindrales bacterium]